MRSIQTGCAPAARPRLLQHSRRYSGPTPAAELYRAGWDVQGGGAGWGGAVWDGVDKVGGVAELLKLI